MSRSRRFTTNNELIPSSLGLARLATTERQTGSYDKKPVSGAAAGAERGEITPALVRQLSSTLEVDESRTRRRTAPGLVEDDICCVARQPTSHEDTGRLKHGPPQDDDDSTPTRRWQL